MSPRDQSGQLRRERDRQQFRTMALAVGLSACLVGGVLELVALEIRQVQLSYRLEKLRATKGKLEELNRRLEVERATLSSLERIDEKARELGLGRPAPDQVLMAREFVVPGKAWGALHTAWETSTAGGGPRVQ
ncbi:MAG: hypothetical protein ACE5JD_03765 [Candidatus Methylomirabilia bacterium]